MNRFKTNTYSKYAPTHVRNTLDNQGLFYETQNLKYHSGLAEHDIVEESLLNMPVAPGEQMWKDNINRMYSEEYKRAQEEGDFENMIGNTKNIIKDYTDNYHLKDLAQSRAAYEQQLEEVENNKDMPLSWKEFQRNEMVFSNRGYELNEEGEPVYRGYQRVKDLYWENVPEALNKLITGWKESGLYEVLPNGQIEIKKDIPGYDAIKANDVISREDLRNFAISYMKNEPNLNRAIEDQAYVDTRSILHKQGSIDKADALALVNKNNPFRENTNNYHAYLEMYSDAFDRILEENINSKGDEEYDLQEEIELVSRVLYDDSLRSSFSRMFEDKFGFTKEKLTTFKTEEGNSTNQRTAEDNPFQAGLFENTIIATGNTINYEALTKNKTKLFEQVKEASDRLEAMKNDGVSTETMIKEVEVEVENLNRRLDANNNISNFAASSVVNSILKSVPLKIKEGGLTYTTDKYTINDYDSLKEKAYENYLKSLGTDRRTARGSMSFVFTTPVKTYTDEYLKINPTADFSERNFLNEEEFNILFDAEVSLAVSNPDYKSLFYNERTLGLNNSIKKARKDESKFNSIFNNLQMFGINTTGLTNAQMEPYKEFIQTLDVISNTILRDGNFNTIEGTPLEQYEKAYGAFDTDRSSITLLSSPIEGDIVALADIRFLSNRDLGVKTLVNLTSGNTNEQVIRSRLNQALTNLSNGLFENYDFLDTDKKDMYYAANSLLNIVDGSLERFNELPLYTAPVGSVHRFELGNDTFEFVPYRTGHKDRNHTLIMQNDVEAFQANKDSRGRQIVDKGVLGYHALDLDENFKPIIDPNTGKPVLPRYYAYNDKKDGTSPVTINRNAEDEKERVQFSEWFVPANYGAPQKVFERLTFEASLSRGNLNKNALENETLYPYSDTYFNQFSHPQTLDTYTDTLIEKGYTEENGYVPLNKIVDSKLIANFDVDSKRGVGLPFLAINNEGINRLALLFRESTDESRGLLPMITGGGRDVNNVVPGSSGQYHESFQALDILKNKASLRILQLIRQNPSKYGIKSYIVKDDHIHLVIDDKYKVEYNSIPKFR